MNLFLQHPDPNNNEPELYSNECSEFLDEAIRMRDLLLMYTETSVAAGSPENLL